MTSLDLDALAARQTIEITTKGRRSGQPKRIEIWWFRVEGRFVITGTPGPRDWVANLRADPRVIVHVDGEDIPAIATFVDDEVFRRVVFTRPQTSWYSSQAELDRLVATAPMVEVQLLG
ncbi:MAG TPA: nitroreductase family deazaflavin-dependent oxidoreductase [Acidimicrobiia bacterium]|nr:nitroreductase family deazaflavin-dependent oxidoreductase [Acidimicrobiia bacterium]